jgi:hypothetical protein
MFVTWSTIFSFACFDRNLLLGYFTAHLSDYRQPLPRFLQETKIVLIYTKSHLTWNPPREHAAEAAGNELVKTQKSRSMLLDGFQITWDSV